MSINVFWVTAEDWFRVREGMCVCWACEVVRATMTTVWMTNIWWSKGRGWSKQTSQIWYEQVNYGALRYKDRRVIDDRSCANLNMVYPKHTDESSWKKTHLTSSSTEAEGEERKTEEGKTHKRSKCRERRRKGKPVKRRNAIRGQTRWYEEGREDFSEWLKQPLQCSQRLPVNRLCGSFHEWLRSRTIAWFVFITHMITHAPHSSISYTTWHNHATHIQTHQRLHTHCLYMQEPVVDSIRVLGHRSACLDHLQTEKTSISMTQTYNCSKA